MIDPRLPIDTRPVRAELLKVEHGYGLTLRPGDSYTYQVVERQGWLLPPPVMSATLDRLELDSGILLTYQRLAQSLLTDGGQPVGMRRQYLRRWRFISEN